MRGTKGTEFCHTRHHKQPVHEAASQWATASQTCVRLLRRPAGLAPDTTRSSPQPANCLLPVQARSNPLLHLLPQAQLLEAWVSGRSCTRGAQAQVQPARLPSWAPPPVRLSPAYSRGMPAIYVQSVIIGSTPCTPFAFLCKTSSNATCRMPFLCSRLKDYRLHKRVLLLMRAGVSAPEAWRQCAERWALWRAGQPASRPQTLPPAGSGTLWRAPCASAAPGGPARTLSTLCIRRRR